MNDASATLLVVTVGRSSISPHQTSSILQYIYMGPTWQQLIYIAISHSRTIIYKRLINYYWPATYDIDYFQLRQCIIVS